MTKDQESGGAPLEQLPDEALCRLIREQDRPAEEVLAARYHRVVRSCARPYFLAGGPDAGGDVRSHQGHAGV